MSKTTLILFAACVGLSLLTLHLVKQMRDGHATIAELQAQVATLERQQEDRRLSPEIPDAPVSTFQAEPAAEPQPAPAAQEIPKAAAVVTRPVVEGNARDMSSPEARMSMFRDAREHHRQLMQDPEYREALRIQHRANIGRQYPGLAEDLRLTPDQTEQLFDLLTDQQMRSNQQMEPVWDTENADPTVMQQRAEQVRQKWAEAQRQNEAELAALLGPEKMHGWKEYQSTIGARHQAEHLRSTLASQGVPLSRDANRAVVKALAEAQKAQMQEHANQARIAGISPAGATGAVSAIAPRGLVAFGSSSADAHERQLELTRKRNQRVLDALSPYLTYEQIEAVRKEHEAQIKMQEANHRLMRAQRESMENDAGHRGLDIVTSPMVGPSDWVPLQ